MENRGIVTKISGSVIDVQFPAGSDLPDINHAVEVRCGDRRILLECNSHIGDSTVRCIALFPTDGLARGAEAVSLDRPVTVPVGEATLGRMLNVIGDPIDEQGPVNAETRWPIHHKAPSFTKIT
ncbi:MAG: F0F1 ATP synthase subunit beta, partial [Oscillospiraceae bacterium]|nr:F0F1 ATP synthase subunit beta [Oscillospiraceae bacterium]